MDLHTTDIAGAADSTAVSTGSPLLEAHGLSVRLGAERGVRNISLTLQRGDIVGLLGLNGAGKSTTLRMLCGVLVPDEGTVTVNGLSMADNALQARAQVGYLPDQPPLYDDMRVYEYLSLTGSIRGLRGKRLKDRQARVIEQCALGDVQRKIISTLSKGYRQRIGLAQALIHEPAVVMLDEPANGLDPQQMDSMRTLIRQVGERQAILFSTHLLSEACATCNRIAIIHDGELVADRPASGDDLQQLFQETTS